MKIYDKQLGLMYVSLAVLTFSTSPVFIRWAGDLSPFVVTGMRMWVGAATVLLIGLACGQRPHIPRADLGRFALWGLVTALHFGLYNASLGLTTVAHSLALVYTSPIWVSLFNALLNREMLPKSKWIGIAITVIGMVVLTRFEPAWTVRMLLGDLLALGSALTFGLYSATGRRQRGRYSLWSYAGGVYAMAGLWLLPLAIFTWKMPKQPGLSWLSILLLGVFPLGIGHTLYNAALRRVHPTLVNIIATQEVTGGILLSWWLLGEVPTLNAVVGALIMLIGVIQVVL